MPGSSRPTGCAPIRWPIDDDALREIIGLYTREAGVRNLEREIGKVLRHAAVRIAEGEAGPVRITAARPAPILGAPVFESEVAMRTSVPGVATGLAWTPVGGDILFIEATRAAGNGHLILTGQLGEVMRESAQAALSIVKNRAASLGIDEKLFEKSDIHVHVPAGAIPKDGPSAGVAMFIALSSLMTDRPVRSDTAMTGEISLRGLVLPVGGIKEKLAAAARAGLDARDAARPQQEGHRGPIGGDAPAARAHLARARRGCRQCCTRGAGGGARRLLKRARLCRLRPRRR